MDPLSLTASIIAILGVGGKAAGAIHKIAALRGAPDVVLALNNEITDLHLVVSAIQDALQRQRNPTLPAPITGTSYNASVASSLQQARYKATELEALHDRLQTFVLSASNTIKFNKVAWLREQPKIHRMLDDLKSVRLKLASALTVLNLTSSFDLEASIETLQVEVRNLQTQHQAQHQQTQQIENQRLMSQETMLRRINDRMDGLQHAQQEAEGAQTQRLTELETSMRGPITNLYAGQQRLEFKLDAITAAQIARTAEREVREDVALTPGSLNRAKRLASRPLAQISVPILTEQCTISCTCICHHWKARRTPKLLEKFIGSLFIGYSGTPVITPPCDDTECISRSSPSLLVTYLFPAWLLARAFMLLARLSASNSLELNIRLPRVISSSSVIWKLSAQGDIDGVRDLFRQKLGSPFDVDDKGGFTPLMYAVSHYHLDLCELLLHEKADPNQQNADNHSAAQVAWLRILSVSKEDDTSRRLRALFPPEGWIESQDFNLVQKTVLGLNVLNLDSLLASIPVSDMDSGDVFGRTALWWAATRGDFSAMSLLLRYKIDVNRITVSGSHPLMAAIWSGNQDCVRLLLPHIRYLNIYDNDGLLALHYAAYRGLDTDIIDATIPPGTGVNSTSLRSRETALTFAVQANKHQTCKHLLSVNADPNLENINGENALHHAFFFNSHQSITVLMRCTEYLRKTKAGETLLHYAAQHSDIRSLEILCTFDVCGISTQDKVTGHSSSQISKNLVGLTALEIAEKRKDVTPKWLAAFRRLHHKFEFGEAEINTNVVSDVAEEFHDAMESQESESQDQ